MGSVVLVLPLLWELAVEQPFWSLGALEGKWQVGTALAAVGVLVLVSALTSFFLAMRGAAAAADAGFGALTILEVMTDVGRDTGFLVQGKRHFSLLDAPRRARIVKARIGGAAAILAAAFWLSAGFGLAVLLAARGLLTPTGILAVALAPTLLSAVAGLVVLGAQHLQVRGALKRWSSQAASEGIVDEGRLWAERLDAAGAAVVMGSGSKGEGATFRTGATMVAALLLLTTVPTVTVSVTSAIGPILAEIAVPAFLSVQEMAGATETLRRYRIPVADSITPGQAGAALQNLAFVGGSQPDAWEKAPETRYAEGWFPDPEAFPDPYSESAARDLMSRPLSGFTPAERAALVQAAEHPAHREFPVLAHARLVDVVSGRWTLPFPDSLSYQSLPWPRFAAFRTAGLAKVAKAAIDLSEGRSADAENGLVELISTGFLLMDQGPTLIDNLMGVVLANMGGDALEGFYRRSGRQAEADALVWARSGAADAARRARAGLVAEDIHSLLQGIPALVEQPDPLRGLRWEYFATFNTLAPCINVHKMVFGPDETYHAWRLRVRDSLVRVPGEVDLFELADGAAAGADPGAVGFLPRLLSLTLGSGRSPGSCAALITKLESGGGL
jgi:hypothetical protein